MNIQKIRFYAVETAKKIFDFVLVFTIIFTAVSLITVRTKAAVSYQGRGTRSDPYLVQTTAQLNGIRNNLSACYKLDNTIDLSGFGNFDPIGCIQGEKGFSGTFTCDLNSDGTPKYIIKNLTVSTGSGASTYKDQNELYKKDGRRWEAGLFGFTKGATISNIFITGANITNTTIGMNSSYNYIPNNGMDEQGTGILIGYAKNTNVKNCYVQGNINSKSNHTGGILGATEDGSVSNSYSNVNITSTGLWNIGGFLGSALGSSTVKECGADGELNNNNCYSTGGFAGCAQKEAAISDCYTNVPGGMSSFAWESVAKMTNCYATGTSITDFEKKTSTNTGCYILSEEKAGQKFGDFAATDMATIVTAFSGNSKWIISNGVPKLKNLITSINDGTYTPREVAENPAPADNTIGQQTEGDASDTTSGSDLQADEKYYSLSEITEKTDAISEPGKATYKQIEEAVKLKESYDNLSDEDKTQFGDERYFKLLEYYNTAGASAAKYITETVEKLPDAKKIKQTNIKEIKSAYSVFEKLTDDLKEKVPYNIQEKLKQLKKAAEKFESSGNDSTGNTIKQMEWIIIGLIIFIDIAALAGTTILVVLAVKIYKKNRNSDDMLSDNGAEQEV